jgi:hypothetical protein
LIASKSYVEFDLCHDGSIHFEADNTDNNDGATWTVLPIIAGGETISSAD